MWYRVFSRSADAASPAALVAHLHAAGWPVVPHVRGDDTGWTSVELRFPGPGGPVRLDRYLTDVDDLRGDLNSFAAELELRDDNPHHTALMQLVIQTVQLVAWQKPDDHADGAVLDTACMAIAIYLAARTDGVYQVDGRGWCAASGEVLVPEL